MEKELLEKELLKKEIIKNYVADFVCTYQMIDDLEESDMLYKSQLIQAFMPDISLYDNKSIDEIFEIINITTQKLYKLYNNNSTIEKLMNKFNDDDREIKFQLCFSYGTFYIMHKIICGLINNNLDESMCNQLIENININ